jgi:hypothetical protein
LASKSSTKYERELLEGLRHAVHGLRAPFTCGGTLVPEKPVTLGFPDNTQIAVLRAKDTFEQERILRPLVERCTAAAFGMGRKTRYDRAVRDALQIKAEGGAFSVLHFDPAASGILEQIRRELTPHIPDALSAELYNVNVYGTGGHFVPHKDTPRGDDMLGTLVVCLPAQFSKGAFVVKHHGVFQTYDWGDAISEQAEPTRIHWAAFFGDVDHQIERVWNGMRVTLTYLLRRGGVKVERSAAPDPGREALNTLLQQKLRALLDDPRFLAKGGTLAFPCSHLYQQDARFQRKQRPISRQTVSSVKGRDHVVAAAAMAEGLQVTLYPYMIETCADETWQLDRFPTPRERATLGYRMGPRNLKDALPIRANSYRAEDFGLVWVDPPPHFNGPPTMYPRAIEGRPQAVDPDLPAVSHLHACEYSATGYFGNEGSETDLYVYCALHVTIPPYGDGARAATATKLSIVSKTHKLKAEPCIYELRITLQRILPPIWRLIQIPDTLRLSHLHDALQTVIGWTDSHLHRFEKDGKQWGVPDVDGEDWVEIIEESRTTIGAVLTTPGDSMLYVYDYGDNWRHNIELEKILPASGAVRPVCLAGERHCPPEDVGGIPGYENFLEVIFEPGHKDHEDYVRWAGRFQAEEFNLKAVNGALSRMRWPGVSKRNARQAPSRNRF